MPSRKTVRLDPKNYSGQIAIFVTLCCYQRRRHFENVGLCRRILEILRETAASRDFAVHAYCLMPDHLHLLVEGLSPISDFLNFIQAFKVRSSRAFHKSDDSQLWQRYFFDHVLRKTEAFESVCLYIWANPVRAGLAKQLGEYEFAGSFTRKIPRTCQMENPWRPPQKQKGPSRKMAPT